MNPADTAALLAGAHSARVQVRTRADLAPQSAGDAYAVQDLVYAAVRGGQRVTAWKVGGPDDKVEPTASPVLRVLKTPARVAAGDFHMIGVEAEVAYKLARDLPPRDVPYSGEEIADAVSQAVVAIEICDTRLADWKEAPDLWKLADFQSNGALVTGPGTRWWRDIDFRAQRAQLLADGRLLADVTGAHPYGDPFRLLPWIVAHCARRCGGLRAGDLVTTGSWGGMHLVQPGCEVMARFPGIGDARLVLAKD